jgi:hypothetical protein
VKNVRAEAWSKCVQHVVKEGLLWQVDGLPVMLWGCWLPSTAAVPVIKKNSEDEYGNDTGTSGKGTEQLLDS